MLRTGCIPALLGLLLAAGSAHSASISFDLTAELDTGVRATFGSVTVTEIIGGDLEFVIEIDPLVLGPASDVHLFYFNLDDSFDDVVISSFLAVDSSGLEQPPSTPYELMADPSVAGGMALEFDYEVSFGNGRGGRGNGQLIGASFTLSADRQLVVGDLEASSATTPEGDPIHVAVHVQGSRQVRATIVGTLTEPGTSLLLAAGLAALAGSRRRLRR